MHWELVVKAVGGMVIEIVSHEVLEANRLSHLNDSQKTCSLNEGIDEMF